MSTPEKPIHEEKFAYIKEHLLPIIQDLIGNSPKEFDEKILSFYKEFDSKDKLPVIVATYIEAETRMLSSQVSLFFPEFSDAIDEWYSWPARVVAGTGEDKGNWRNQMFTDPKEFESMELSPENVEKIISAEFIFLEWAEEKLNEDKTGFGLVDGLVDMAEKSLNESGDGISDIMLGLVKLGSERYKSIYNIFQFEQDRHERGLNN